MFKQAVEQSFEHIANPSLYELKKKLAALPCSLEDLRPYVLEPSDLPYGRHTLYLTDQVEVVVIHLPPHSQTAIHDHGDSIGCARVVAGTIENAMYRIGGYGFAHELGSVDCPSGDYLYAGKGQVHALVNETEEPAVSLHVYSPPLTVVRRYKPMPALDYVI